MPVHTPGGPNPTGLQLWIDLPKAEKMSEPLYQELKSTEVSAFVARRVSTLYDHELTSFSLFHFSPHSPLCRSRPLTLLRTSRSESSRASRTVLLFVSPFHSFPRLVSTLVETNQVLTLLPLSTHRLQGKVRSRGVRRFRSLVQVSSRRPILTLIFLFPRELTTTTSSSRRKVLRLSSLFPKDGLPS